MNGFSIVQVLRTVARWTVCVMLGFSLAFGCSSDEVTKVGLARGCVLTSDCNPPLVCTFGRCHAACESSADCPTGERCVFPTRDRAEGGTSANVCQLEQESTCVYNSDCKQPLVCAIDQQCRNECNADRDCPKAQLCAKSNVCADRAEVDANGALKGALRDGAVRDAVARTSDGGDGGSTGNPTCASEVPEGRTVTFACPSGETIDEVSIAAFGTPSGQCGSFEKDPKCDAPGAQSFVEQQCLGQERCTFTVSNAAFGGDPCFGTSKHFDGQVRCGPKPCQPPCMGGSCCSGTCITLSKDAANCGTCGNACPAGESCVAGVCRSCSGLQCSGKACGDDGCGNSCGSCSSGAVCQEGKCVACSPKCNGSRCGSDGCGNTCGKCSTNEACVTGQCVAASQCSPKCAGALCGGDDGCGGKCQGACPGGGTCTNGTCAGICTPDCTRKACGNDGCAGDCGACPWPESCENGVCVCKSLCTTEGRQCGSDGCGGTCGSCPSGQTCADDQSGAPQPTYQCLDQSNGCSDGSREGFKDTSAYPTVAACAASWSSQSLQARRTSGWCGNGLGECTVPEDACSPGWHLCMKNGWPGDLHDRLAGADCGSPVAGTGVFLAASDLAVHDNCCPSCTYAPLPVGCGAFNDGWTIACGSTSSLRNGCADEVWTGATYAATNVACNVATGSTANGVTGVLCCKDPPVSGH